MAALTYPETRYEPSPLVDLNSRAERERLSASGLKGFFNIMQRWQVRDEDARALLGGVSNGPYYELKRAGAAKVLESDRLLRLSYLIGIFKALHILHSRALADQWVQLPNSNRLFGGETPLAYMVRGGLPALHSHNPQSGRLAHRNLAPGRSTVGPRRQAAGVSYSGSSMLPL